MYRVEWDCCGSVTETDGYLPHRCPICERDDLTRRNAELAARLAVLEAQLPVGNLHSHPDYGHEFTPRIPGDWSMLGADLYIRPVQATTSQ